MSILSFKNKDINSVLFQLIWPINKKLPFYMAVLENFKWMELYWEKFFQNFNQIVKTKV